MKGKVLLKTVSAFLAGLMIVTAISAQAFAADNKINVNTVKGDADGDGKVTIADAAAIQRYLAGFDMPESFDLTVCDCNGNGDVSIDDVTEIQRYLADLPSHLGEKSYNDQLYDYAVRDAIKADENEIMPLVNITKEDDRVIWNGDKVLVAFMHKYPDSYKPGSHITLQWGNVWCVSAREMANWVKNNAEGVTDWTERLHQVLGMPLSKEYTSVTALWVDADLLYRPANVSDPTAEMKATYQPTGDEKFDKMFKEWYDSNVKWSYYDSAYPWTRLGYTYDWADNGTEYGLSEFIVFSGAEADVEYTYSVNDYIAFVTEG